MNVSVTINKYAICLSIDGGEWGVFLGLEDHHPAKSRSGNDAMIGVKEMKMLTFTPRSRKVRDFVSNETFDRKMSDRHGRPFLGFLLVWGDEKEFVLECFYHFHDGFPLLSDLYERCLIECLHAWICRYGMWMDLDNVVTVFLFYGFYRDD